MPRTEFYRPNPLDSDVIMDATARLLAPRRLTLSQERPSRPVQQEGRNSRRKKEAARPHAPAGEKPREHKQAKEKAARTPEEKRTAPAPKRRRERRGDGRRGMPPEPRRQQHKDSTEQPSLMKPYYLDLGK